MDFAFDCRGERLRRRSRPRLQHLHRRVLLCHGHVVVGLRILEEEPVCAGWRDADNLDPWAVWSRLAETPPERVLPGPQQIGKPPVNDRHRAGPLVVCLSETASALDWNAQSGKI